MATFTLGLAEVALTSTSEPVAPGLGRKLISSSPRQIHEGGSVAVGVTVGVWVCVAVAVGVAVGTGTITKGKYT